MSTKMAIALGALLLIVAVTALQQQAEQAADSRGADTTVSLPSVDPEQVDTLEVAAPDKTPVTLVKSDAGWALSEPVAAEASERALETALDKLSDLDVTGVAATQVKNHERLEVSEGKAIHVVAKQGDVVQADLWIGVYRSGSTMVREAGKDEVAAVRGSIRYAFDKEVKDWRNRTVTDIPSDNVARLTLETKAGTVVLERKGDTFEQAAGQPPIERFDEAKAKSVVSSVARLTAVDFAGPEIDPAAVGTVEGRLSRVTLELSGDAGASQVVLKLGEKKGNHYYLQREGNDVIYRVARFVGDRLSKGPEEFVKPEESKAATASPHAKAPTKIYPQAIH